MSRVEEIEAAITNLPHEEYVQLLEWFQEREQVLWDQQMNRDAADGKLDFLVREADEEAEQGLLRDWPTSE
jgi:hypothetical protein